MNDPTNIIREAARVALESFAQFLQQETTIVLSDKSKRILAENLDHSFHSFCTHEYGNLLDICLEDLDKCLEDEDFWTSF